VTNFQSVHAVDKSTIPSYYRTTTEHSSFAINPTIDKVPTSTTEQDTGGKLIKYNKEKFYFFVLLFVSYIYSA